MTGPTYKHFEIGDKVWPVVKQTGQVVRYSPITVTIDKNYIVNGKDIAYNSRVFPRHHFLFKVKDKDGRLVFEDRKAVEPLETSQGNQGGQEDQGDSKPASIAPKGVGV